MVRHLERHRGIAGARCYDAAVFFTEQQAESRHRPPRLMAGGARRSMATERRKASRIKGATQHFCVAL